MLVVPRELLPRRLHTACAIGLALNMWPLLGETEAVAHQRHPENEPHDLLGRQSTEPSVAVPVASSASSVQTGSICDSNVLSDPTGG